MASPNASVAAPGPGVFAPPPPPTNATALLKPGCDLGDVTCLGTQVSDNQIVTALWVSCIVGAASLLFFAAMRGRIKTYHTRLELASVWIMPPRLPMGGIHHLWSWLYPIFTTSDAELVHTAGLDSLMLSWTCSLGIQIFLPLTILGSVILLPVNLSGNRVDQESQGDQRAAISTFSKLTVSNIARGSADYWVVFAFVYIVIIYVCWLLVKYYQAYVVLRQHYLTGGENLINEWSIQFLANKEAEASDGKSASSAFQVIRNIFDPASQMGTIVEEIEEAASVFSGHPGTHGTIGEALSKGRAGSQYDGRGDGSSMVSGQSRPMSLSAALRRRRLGDRDHSISPPRSRKSAGPISPRSHEAPISQPSQTGELSVSIPEAAGDSVTASQAVSPRDDSAGPTPQESAGHRRCALSPTKSNSNFLAAPSAAEVVRRLGTGGSGSSRPTIEGSPALSAQTNPAASSSWEQDASTPAQGLNTQPSSLQSSPQEGVPGSLSNSPASEAAAELNAQSPEEAPCSSKSTEKEKTKDDSKEEGQDEKTVSAEKVRVVSMTQVTALPAWHPRRGSELTREVLEAAGLAPEHDAEPRDAGAGEVVHEAVVLNPGGGGLRSALRGRFRNRSRTDSRESGLTAPPQEEEEHVTGRPARKHVRFLSRGFGSLGGLGKTRSGSLLKKGTERSDSLERGMSLPSVSAMSADAPGDAPVAVTGAISKYERNAPSNEGRERIHRWWMPAESVEEGSRMGAILSGKPNVSFRKIVNTQLPEGRTIGVNAQQYAVLVMDVPDLSKERMKSAKRAMRNRWWWRLWYRFAAFCKRTLFLRKHIDRTTGGLVLPPTSRRPTRQTSDLETGTQTKQESGHKPPTLELTEIHVDQDHLSPNEPIVWSPADAPGSTPMPRDLTDKPRQNGGIEKSGNPFQDAQPQRPRSPTEQARWHKASQLYSKAAQDGHRMVDITIRFFASSEGRLAHAIAVSDGGIKANGVTNGVTGDGKASFESMRSGKSNTSAGTGPRSPKDDETAESPSAADEEAEANSETLVAETFRALFPDSFDGVLPVRKHKAVDLLLKEWDKAWHKLLAAENEYEESGCTKRPEGKPHCCGCTGKRVDKIDFWAGEVRRLEVEIVAARKAAMEAPARTSFFVFFTSQKDAAIAAQTNLHPEDGHSFRVKEAPGPEEVNWQALWMTWAERDFRGVVTLIPLLILMLVPIGLFSGSVNQATVAICGGSSKFFNKFYSTWYCKNSSLARSFVTGVLPSVLLMLWQNLVMPTAVYRIAQQQGACPSLSQLDRRIGVIFFVWDVFNVFLGAMLGGSIFSQLGLFINNPGSIPQNIGAALPAASNFFVNYIIIQAFATQTVRLLLPHLGIFPELFRLCGCCKPTSELQKMEALSVHSIRYGREMGSLMLIVLMAATYSATSPIILPFTLLYFAFAWIHWRYNILYISERCYESGGRIWDLVFTCIIWILFIFELFTGFVLLANSAFTQAGIMWVTVTPMLYKFSQYCEVRYGRAVRHMPLETATQAPPARVPAVVYLPPALRRGAAGWYPEFGKAWENFGMPTYSW